MIRLSNIEKAFSQGVTKTYVFRRIDLDIQQGRRSNAAAERPARCSRLSKGLIVVTGTLS